MDVRLYCLDGEGEIDFVNGKAVLDEGILTAVYLSLFGGNERDGGGQATESLQWWGNLIEKNPARRYRSELQHLLWTLPLVPFNLLRLQAAAERDLAWMLGDDGPATALTVRVTMPGLNRVLISGELLIDSRKVPFSFSR